MTRDVLRSLRRSARVDASQRLPCSSVYVGLRDPSLSVGFPRSDLGESPPAVAMCRFETKFFPDRLHNERACFDRGGTITGCGLNPRSPASNWGEISRTSPTVLRRLSSTHSPTPLSLALSLVSLDGSQDVCHLSFSPDEKFLLGCGGDRLVYVWDTSTGELVTGKQYAEPSTLGEWTGVKLSGRRPIYEVSWTAHVVIVCSSSVAGLCE